MMRDGVEAGDHSGDISPRKRRGETERRKRQKGQKGITKI